MSKLEGRALQNNPTERQRKRWKHRIKSNIFVPLNFQEREWEIEIERWERRREGEGERERETGSKANERH
jgi:hypothetical protein